MKTERVKEKRQKDQNESCAKFLVSTARARDLSKIKTSERESGQSVSETWREERIRVVLRGQRNEERVALEMASGEYCSEHSRLSL